MAGLTKRIPQLGDEAYRLRRLSGTDVSAIFAGFSEILYLARITYRTIGISLSVFKAS